MQGHPLYLFRYFCLLDEKTVVGLTQNEESFVVQAEGEKLDFFGHLEQIPSNFFFSMLYYSERQR